MAMGIVDDKEFFKEKSTLLKTPTGPSASELNEELRARIRNELLNEKGAVITPDILTPSIRAIQSEQKSEQKKGRPPNGVEVPNSLRKLVGEESAVHGRESALELAESLGISPSSVSAYNKGATSTASYGNRPNLPHINAAKEKIGKRARMKLFAALQHITEEKLGEAKVGELASVARSMSAIVKDMEPESEKSGQTSSNNPTFVFYSPQSKPETTFEVIKLPE